MRRIAAVVLVLCFMVCGRAYAAPGLPYYLALGDSLGHGTQPLPNGTLVDTNQGYVNGVSRSTGSAIRCCRSPSSGAPANRRRR